MSRPAPWLRWALHLPTRLYDADLGRLLGHRFLMLTHVGRRTGRRYRTVLEVLEWRAGQHEAIVMSGFGPQSQWLRNLQAGGGEEVRIGRERWSPQLRMLEPAEATAVLAEYERRNRLAAPVVRIVLSRLARLRYDGSDEARRQVVETLPLLGLRPDV